MEKKKIKLITKILKLKSCDDTNMVSTVWILFTETFSSVEKNTNFFYISFILILKTTIRQYIIVE